jgi:hypothetical protein
MRDDCWLKPGTVKAEFEQFFSDADKQLSIYYEDNPAMREEHIEGRLVTLLDGTHFDIYQKRINKERLAQERPLLTMEFKHITNRERNHGADVGLVARLNIPGEIVLTKAVLIQSKRLYPRQREFTQDCDYPELFTQRDTIPSQWDRMLDITASSAYFFYNPDRLKIGKSMRPVGTRVMSAQAIKGMAAAGRRTLSVRDLIKESRSFSSWVVDQFICCDIGDPHPETIDIAMGANADFTVRHSIQMIIERTDITPELFAR